MFSIDRFPSLDSVPDQSCLNFPVTEKLKEACKTPDLPKKSQCCLKSFGRVCPPPAMFPIDRFPSFDSVADQSCLNFPVTEKLKEACKTPELPKKSQCCLNSFGHFCQLPPMFPINRFPSFDSVADQSCLNFPVTEKLKKACETSVLPKKTQCCLNSFGHFCQLPPMVPIDRFPSFANVAEQSCLNFPTTEKLKKACATRRTYSRHSRFGFYARLLSQV